MTIYKLYKKREGRESAELGWEFVITGSLRLSFVAPGLDKEKIYSHYDVEVFCFCEHCYLRHSFFGDQINIEEDLDLNYELRAVNGNVDLLISGAANLANECYKCKFALGGT